MSNSAEEFSKVLHLWKEENAMPWGLLRYDTSRMNIARHTDERKLRILDVGGGDGMNAVYYAKLGHSVTLTDCSSKMLSEAKKFAAEQGVSGQVKIIQTETDNLSDLLDEQPYDLILCHMMIEFVPDAQVLFSEMCELLCKGGLISILDTNRYADVYMKAFQVKSLPDAIKSLGIKEYFHPWVNRSVPRFSADHFIDQLNINGCTLAGHYGVLNICAFLPNEPKFSPEYFKELKELEHLLSDQYPYYLLARYFQVIARKN
ncbi:MAG: methyltransferase domain-containing protein [Anaerolineae bacterium]|nr:methyltransferase domain-containing protein [Anaerolineae bacterium]